MLIITALVRNGSLPFIYNETRVFEKFLVSKACNWIDMLIDLNIKLANVHQKDMTVQYVSVD